MQLFEGNLLHVYNRGNNKQQVFFEEEHYRLFLYKVGKHIGTVSDILAYCLMPNHFHFLLHVNELSCKPKQIGTLLSTNLQNGFRVLQSSYASSINRQLCRTGSIFQQNTKFKLLNDEGNSDLLSQNYAEVCFHYIHQNPLKAGLVNKLEDWQYCSFNEYLSADQNVLCNKELAVQLIDLNMHQFYENSYAGLKEELIEKIWSREK